MQVRSHPLLRHARRFHARSVNLPGSCSRVSPPAHTLLHSCSSLRTTRAPSTRREPQPVPLKIFSSFLRLKKASIYDLISSYKHRHRRHYTFQRFASTHTICFSTLPLGNTICVNRVFLATPLASQVFIPTWSPLPSERFVRFVLVYRFTIPKVLTKS